MTSADKNEKSSSIRNQFFAVLTVNIITFNQGNAIGWVSPTLPVLMGADSPLDEPPSQTVISLIASTFCIGAMAGTLTYGWLADKLGRKRAALSTAIPFLISWSLKLFWPTPYTLILGRLIIGFGSASMLVVAPIYTSELASVQARGLLGSMLTLTFNLGILVMYVIGEYFSYRMVLTIMICVPVLFLILMFRMPESPPFLIQNGKYQEAAEALAWFRQLPSDSPQVKKEIEQITYAMNMSAGSNKNGDLKKRASPVKMLFTSGPCLKTLCAAGGLLGLQSLMGMFALMSYASDIFQNAGSSLSPGVSSIVIGMLQLIGSFVASFFIDRLGRKILLIGSTLSVSLAMAVLAGYFYASSAGYNTSHLGIIPVVSLSVVVCTFAMGIGPVPFILPSEMFIMQVRGLATSICLICMWTSSFICAQFFVPLVAYFGNHVVFLGFSFVGLMAVALVVLFIPETKGVPVEHIYAHFGGEKNPDMKNQDDELGVPLKNMSTDDVY